MITGASWVHIFYMIVDHFKGKNQHKWKLLQKGLIVIYQYNQEQHNTQVSWFVEAKIFGRSEVFRIRMLPCLGYTISTGVSQCLCCDGELEIIQFFNILHTALACLWPQTCNIYFNSINSMYLYNGIFCIEHSFEENLNTPWKRILKWQVKASSHTTLNVVMVVLTVSSFWSISVFINNIFDRR